MIEKKSGLRGSTVEHRVETAKNIVGSFFLSSLLHQDRYRGHTLKNVAFGTFKGPGGSRGLFRASDPKKANFGGFEIHHDGSRIGAVFVLDLGKPSIQVKKGYERLGRDIAGLFKSHARYWLMPSVHVRDKIPSLQEDLE